MDLINLALDKKDKEWFIELSQLSKKYNSEEKIIEKNNKNIALEPLYNGDIAIQTKNGVRRPISMAEVNSFALIIIYSKNNNKIIKKDEEVVIQELEENEQYLCKTIYLICFQKQELEIRNKNLTNINKDLIEINKDLIKNNEEYLKELSQKSFILRLLNKFKK